MTEGIQEGVKHMNNGSILKTLLSQRGMTIKDLAQKTGISIHTLYSITKRNSYNIRRVNLVKIFKALGVSELEFYLGEQLIAGFIEGIQLTDPVFAIRIRSLVEENINERQPELIESEVEE